MCAGWRLGPKVCVCARVRVCVCPHKHGSFGMRGTLGSGESRAVRSRTMETLDPGGPSRSGPMAPTCFPRMSAADERVNRQIALRYAIMGGGYNVIYTVQA